MFYGVPLRWRSSVPPRDHLLNSVLAGQLAGGIRCIVKETVRIL